MPLKNSQSSGEDMKIDNKNPYEIHIKYNDIENQQSPETGRGLKSLNKTFPNHPSSKLLSWI